MATLERDGASIHYEVSGEGPAVVLGHSLLCDREMWRDVAPRLAARCRVIDVEVRGHRRSTAPGPFTLEDLADDWLAILDREGIERAALVGLSMGGMTAMRLALRAPGRVTALALIDSSADVEPGGRRLQNRIMAAIYRRFGIVGAIQGKVRRLMLGATAVATRPDLVAWLDATVARHDRAQLVHAIRAVNDRGPLLDRLGELACPTLVLVGAEDVATPPVKSERIAAAIAGARLEVLPATGHLSALQAPDAVADHLLRFLDEVTRAPAAARR